MDGVVAPGRTAVEWARGRQDLWQRGMGDPRKRRSPLGAVAPNAATDPGVEIDPTRAK